MYHTMSSISSLLPKPKHSYSSQQKKSNNIQLKSINDLTTEQQQQLITKRQGPPPYGKRSGWKPRSELDFADGGAFPEIPLAQYPLGMGKKISTNKSNHLILRGDKNDISETIAKQGHGSARIVQSSFTDLIPLKHRPGGQEVSLARPSQEIVEQTTKKTMNALQAIIDNKVQQNKPTNFKKNKNEPTYVRYTPSSNTGGSSTNPASRQRIIKIVDVQEDPMEPPKFKHTKVPAGPPSPPAPVLRSPPRRLTAQDQKDWYIPPAISNWKNQKGFTIAVDKRLATNGSKHQEHQLNDKHAKLAEALFIADRQAREEVRDRAIMRKKLAEREAEEKEKRLQEMAENVRKERMVSAASSSTREIEDGPQSISRSRSRRRLSSRSPSNSRSRSNSPYRYHSYSSSRSISRSRSRSRSNSPRDDERERAAHRRAEINRERRKEAQKELRMSRMGTERRIKALARDQDRDISEKVALGIAKPSIINNGETQFDSRLFSQVSAPLGYNEDQVYDKSLFSAQEGLRSIYRPSINNDDNEDKSYDKLVKDDRFDIMGEGASNAREAGPVQFEKDDLFGLKRTAGEIDKATEYGLQGGSKKRK